ncbi:MAG: alkaline phosphatase [Acidobacteria bacterium]|nr:alkaline phosphatase [Acidobacteriota bacterium]
MGDSEITIARNYHVGAAGRLVMDTLPLTGAYTTYAVQETSPALPDYVTDSAASGTGWATGFKTSNGRISTIAGSTGVSPLTTILELAQRAGLRTGNVTTAELTDATPAVLNAHVNERACQGPANMAGCAVYKKEVGGPGSIAEQTIDHHVDVLLGGGRQRFAQTITGGPHAGKTVIQSAELQGYNLVYDEVGLSAALAGKRLLGLFNNGNMTLEWTGAQAAPFPGSGPQVCTEGQRELLTNEPSLAEMTTKALELLEGDDDRDGRPGFFLQVEGASIDKQDHVENPCQQIGETIAFDEAINVGLEFAKRHPQTLIIVTADHAHTSQIVPVVSASEAFPRPGFLSTLFTHDGAKMTVNYATRAHLQSQDHTGAQVRIAAQGPQAANVAGVTDQTDLFRTMARALGLMR